MLNWMGQATITVHCLCDCLLGSLCISEQNKPGLRLCCKVGDEVETLALHLFAEPKLYTFSFVKDLYPNSEKQAILLHPVLGFPLGPQRRVNRVIRVVWSV